MNWVWQNIKEVSSDWTGMTLRITYRSATGDDVEEMKSLIFQHGPNKYNYLPKEQVERHLEGIKVGEVKAVLAMAGHRIVGFVSFKWGKVLEKYSSEAHGYIAEAVVSREFAGKGIGSRLLSFAIKELQGMGYDTIYIDRHAENEASKRMMEKNGFVEVETYFDPKRREFGSRKTTVCVLKE